MTSPRSSRRFAPRDATSSRRPMTPSMGSSGGSSIRRATKSSSGSPSRVNDARRRRSRGGREEQVMADWKPYDPTWLAELAKAQLPEESWLPGALAACTRALKESEAYIHFVDPAPPDEPDSEWQGQTDLTLQHPTEGDLVLDILE